MISEGSPSAIKMKQQRKPILVRETCTVVDAALGKIRSEYQKKQEEKDLGFATQLNAQVSLSLTVELHLKPPHTGV